MNRSKRMPKELQAGVAMLRQAKTVINPDQKYSMENPLGGTFMWSGAQLIETAEAFTEFSAALHSGDKARIKAALSRIESCK